MEEILLFSVWRDEWWRARAFIEHYSSLGVAHFFIVDNASRRPPPEWLRHRPDVTLASEGGSFGGSMCGLRWIAPLLRAHAVGHWTIVCDADEHLILPIGAGGSLPEFCSSLSSKGYEAVYALLLDLYPKRDLRSLVDGPYDPELYFEVDTITRHGVRQPPLEPTPVQRGGVRRRVFGLPVALDKVPLVRYSDRARLSGGMHWIQGARLAPWQAVALHHKFQGDVAARCHAEAERGEHWLNAVEYKAYDRVLRQGECRLWRPTSVPYGSPDQLCDLGILSRFP